MGGDPTPRSAGKVVGSVDANLSNHGRVGGEAAGAERPGLMALERWLRVTIGMVLVAAAAYLLFRLRFVLVTVSIAAMLAYALLPLVDGLARVRVAGRAMPRFGAVLTVFLVVTILLVVACQLAARPIAAESGRFAQNVQQYEVQLATGFSQVRASVGAGLSPAMRAKMDEALNQAGGLIVAALSRVMQMTARWLTHIIEIVMIPILAFYFLVDLPSLGGELLEFLPPTWRGTVLWAAPRADRILAGYVRGQIILMAISGVVVSVGLAIIHMPFPLLLGIVAGLTRAIPVVGPVLGGIPIVGLALLQSPNTAAAVLIFFVALQLVESQIIIPQIIGHELRLRAATILLALLIGNALFGLTGMFLAAPAAAFLKALGELANERAAEPRGVARERPG